MPIAPPALDGNPESRHADTFRLKVDEEQSLRRLRGLDIGTFHKIPMPRRSTAETIPVDIIHEGVQAVTSGANSFKQGIFSLVAGTFIDRSIPNIATKGRVIPFQHPWIGDQPGAVGPTRNPPTPVLARSPPHVLNQPILRIILLRDPSQAEMPLTVHTGNALAGSFGFAQRRQEHPGENRDDRNHHQELDQSEPPPVFLLATRLHSQVATQLSQFLHLDVSKVYGSAGMFSLQADVSQGH